LKLTRTEYEQLRAAYPNGAHLSQLDPYNAARAISDTVHLGRNSLEEWLAADKKNKGVRYLPGLQQFITPTDLEHPGIGANPPWEAIAASIRIYRGESPETAITGSKLISFYNQLINPYGLDAVIDRWMLRAGVTEDAVKHYVALHTKPDGTMTKAAQKGVVDPNVLGTPDPYKMVNKVLTLKDEFDPTVTVYNVFADAVRRIALETHLPVSDVQAIIWAQVNPDVQALLRSAPGTMWVNVRPRRR
jgi:hypothetical protein